MASFSDSLFAEIRKEVGEHLMRRRDYRKANENFEQSLKLKPNKLESVFHLTNSQAREANLDVALKLLTESSRLNAFKYHFKCNLQQCDCTYEKNLFEKSLTLTCDKSRSNQNSAINIPFITANMVKKQNEARKQGPKVAPLKQRSDMIRTNFDDMIGNNAGNCLYDQRKYFEKVIHTWQPQDPSTFPLVKSRALLKVKNCDTESIVEDSIQSKSVKEKYRIASVKRKFAQCYMQSAWKDYEFINNLRTNRTLQGSNQNSESFDTINREIEDCVEKTGILIQQLHARCPLYTYNQRMFPDPKHKEKANRAIRFRLQYQTRRQMFGALDAMLKCRNDGKLKKLIEIAEHELGVHYQIKPNKIMPRKKEFLIEICNLIGLAHLDKLKLPEKREQMENLEQLAAIFNISLVNKHAVVPYVFGDQSTYHDPAEADPAFLIFKQNVNRLEERMKFALMSIEKCHLYHEMGKQNLKQNKYDETRGFARKVIDESHDAGSTLWKFLGQILMCRADVSQKNFFRINDSLQAALTMVDGLQDPNLKVVIEFALKVRHVLKNVYL